IANDDLTNAHNYRFVEQPEKLLSHDYSEMNNKLYTFLDKLAVHYLSK
ncbi:MAG: glutamine amidotransferase, partial [Pseudomonadota bacterium]